MVVTSKPITKYCCSDTTQTEARIIGYFSILTTIVCLLILFITYSHVSGEFFKGQNGLPVANFNSSAPNETEAVDCIKVSGRIDLDDLEQHHQNSSTTTTVEPEPELISDQLKPEHRSLDLNETETEAKATSTKFPDLELGNGNGNESENLTITTTRQPYDTELYMLRAKAMAENSSAMPLPVEKLVTYGNETLFRSDDEDAGAEATICGPGTKKISKKNSNADKKFPERSELDLMAEFLLWDDTTELKWILPPFIWNVLDLTRGLLILWALRRRNACLDKLWFHMTSIQCITALALFVPIMISLTTGEFKAIFSLLFFLVLCYNFYGMWIVNTMVSDITSVSSSGPGSGGQFNKGYVSDQVTHIEVISVPEYPEKFRVVTFEE